MIRIRAIRARAFRTRAMPIPAQLTSGRKPGGDPSGDDPSGDVPGRRPAPPFLSRDLPPDRRRAALRGHGRPIGPAHSFPPLVPRRLRAGRSPLRDSPHHSADHPVNRPADRPVDHPPEHRAEAERALHRSRSPGFPAASQRRVGPVSRPRRGGTAHRGNAPAVSGVRFTGSTDSAGSAGPRAATRSSRTLVPPSGVSASPSETPGGEERRTRVGRRRSGRRWRRESGRRSGRESAVVGRSEWRRRSGAGAANPSF